MTNYILFLPFGYGMNTRAKTKIHRVSLFATFFAPVAINQWFLLDWQLAKMVWGFIAFACVYIIYEIGYIYNDVYTTKKEENPTRWLKYESMEPFVERLYPVLVACRAVYAAGLIILLYHFDEAQHVGLFILLLALMNFVFSLHNYFRDYRNFFTDSTLNCLKYTIPLVPFVTGITDMQYVIFVLFEIAFVRSVEFGIGKDYFFTGLRRFDVDIRRIVYYTCLLIIAVFFYKALHSSVAFVCGAGFMLIYRGLCFILMKSASLKVIRWENGDRK